jgi:hypothetical protein
MRNISKRFKLEPGDYVIVPSTYDENVRLKFWLRVFTESELGREVTLHENTTNANNNEFTNASNGDRFPVFNPNSNGDAFFHRPPYSPYGLNYSGGSAYSNDSGIGSFNVFNGGQSEIGSFGFSNDTPVNNMDNNNNYGSFYNNNNNSSSLSNPSGPSYGWSVDIKQPRSDMQSYNPGGRFEPPASHLIDKIKSNILSSDLVKNFNLNGRNNECNQM